MDMIVQNSKKLKEGQGTGPCATRLTSIYKGLATLPYKM